MHTCIDEMTVVYKLYIMENQSKFCTLWTISDKLHHIMKAYLSKNTVKELVLMLDDAYQADSEEHPDFDYIRIMKNLLLANKHRDENNQLELSSETIEWLFSILDIMLYKNRPSGRKVSDKSRAALKEKMNEQCWQAKLICGLMLLNECLTVQTMWCYSSS